MLPQEKMDLEPDSASEDDGSLQEHIDLAELAQKIVDMLIREISIEAERLGR